jgi:hypothetical protein
MDKVYITLANSLKIVRNLDLKFSHNKENIYNRPIVFFNYSDNND